MSSIQRVRECLSHVEAAEAELRAEAVAAVRAGVPGAAVARAANRSYNTLKKWLYEDDRLPSGGDSTT